MDFATILGLIAAFGLVIAAIGGEQIVNFIDGPSILIVFGGTFGATFIAFPIRDVFNLAGIVKNTILFKASSPNEIIEKLVNFSSKARRDGILALESAAGEIDDRFMARGIQLAVDGQEPSAIENILSLEIDSVQSRHQLGADILSTMGTFAPAMGMIGTLIGLVQMLQHMDDPGAIGPSMSLALLTTFYGAIMATMIFNPLAAKLKGRSSVEITLKDLTREGIMAIAAGDNPRIVEQKLHAFLRPKQRVSLFD